MKGSCLGSFHSVSLRDPYDLRLEKNDSNYSKKSKGTRTSPSYAVVTTELLSALSELFFHRLSSASFGGLDVRVTRMVKYFRRVFHAISV